jgi:hypothetical protein
VFTKILLAGAVCWASLSFLADCSAQEKKEKLTPEGGKQALLAMMRSKEGKKLGWFNGTIPAELAKRKIKKEKDGWYAWDGAFRLNPDKAEYTFVVQPRPGVRACVLGYQGSFVRKGGAWTATLPQLVRTALQEGK